MASYSSNHSSRSATPRASFPSEPTSTDSALGSDCLPEAECPYGTATRTSQHTFATATYASTISEDMDVAELEDEILPAERPAVSANVVPSSPKDFAELFPSPRRMLIRHDDTTIDGNMNLRIDTPVKTTHGHLKDMTLFHLRMHDLKRRDFSLRRYCRDSGREVCHTSRKPETAPDKKQVKSPRGSFMRGLRSASNRTNSDSLRRSDSGYESEGEMTEVNRKSTVVPPSPGASSAPLSNDICLEFSNYARFKLTYGTRDDKLYNFEYYGLAYAWEKIPEMTLDGVQIRYTLVRLWDRTAVAHIAPMPLNEDESRMEVEKGGWIPPCTMWIADKSVAMGPGDVADVVVVTGLVALADDTIRRRFEGHPVFKKQQSLQQFGLRKAPSKSLWSKLSCM